MVKTILVAGLIALGGTAVAEEVWKPNKTETKCLEAISIEAQITPGALLQNICKANGKEANCQYESRESFFRDFNSYVIQRCKGLPEEL